MGPRGPPLPPTHGPLPSDPIYKYLPASWLYIHYFVIHIHMINPYITLVKVKKNTVRAISLSLVHCASLYMYCNPCLSLTEVLPLTDWHLSIHCMQSQAFMVRIYDEARAVSAEPNIKVWILVNRITGSRTWTVSFVNKRDLNKKQVLIAYGVLCEMKKYLFNCLLYIKIYAPPKGFSWNPYIKGR